MTRRKPPDEQGKAPPPRRPGARGVGEVAHPDTLEGRKAITQERMLFGRRFVSELGRVLEAHGDERERLAFEFRKRYNLSPNEIDLQLEHAIARNLSLTQFMRSEAHIIFATNHFLKKLGLKNVALPDLAHAPEILRSIYDGEAFSYAEKLLMLDAPMDFVFRRSDERPFGLAPARSCIFVSGIRASFCAESVDAVLKPLSVIVSEMQRDGLELAYRVPESAFLMLFDARGVSWANNIGSRILGDAKLAYYFNEFPGILEREILLARLYGRPDGHGPDARGVPESARGAESRAFIAASAIGTNGDDDLAVLAFGDSLVHYAIAEAFRKAADGARSFLEGYLTPSGRRLKSATRSHALSTFFNANAAYIQVRLLGKDANGVIDELRKAIRLCKARLEPTPKRISSMAVLQDVGEALEKRAGGAQRAFLRTTSERGSPKHLLYVYPSFVLSGATLCDFQHEASKKRRWSILGRHGAVPLKALNYVLTHDQVSQVVLSIAERLARDCGFTRVGSSGFVFAYRTKDELKEALARLGEPQAGSFDYGIDAAYHCASAPCPAPDARGSVMLRLEQAVSFGRLMAHLEGPERLAQSQVHVHPRSAMADISPALCTFISRMANFCKASGTEGRKRNEVHVGTVYLAGPFPMGDDGETVVTDGMAGEPVSVSVHAVQDEYLERFITDFSDKYGMRFASILGGVPSNCDPHEVATILQQRVALKGASGRMEEMKEDLVRAAAEYARIQSLED